jgi:hypothetical protein
MTPRWTFAPRKPYRRRCHSLPAAVTTAAEAQSEALGLGYLDRSAARLPQVIGAVETSANSGSCPLPGQSLRLVSISPPLRGSRPFGRARIRLWRRAVRRTRYSEAASGAGVDARSGALRATDLWTPTHSGPGCPARAGRLAASAGLVPLTRHWQLLGMRISLLRRRP